MRSDGTRAKTRYWLTGFVSITLVVLYVGGNLSADTDAVAPAPAPEPIALVGAMIRTQTDAGDFVGTIVIKDRQIVAMGANITPPADARRIDVANHVITPGLIDARSVLWLNASTAREGGRDASLNMIDGIDPYADDWRDAARQGVTAVYVQPHNSGSLGGGGAVLRVGPTVTAEELVIRHPAGVQAALGIAGATQTPTVNPLAEIFARLGLPAPPAQAPTAAPSSNALTRYAQYESLRGQFDAAKKYGESKPPLKDAGKELLLRAMKKELPVRLEVGHEDDVRNSLKLADLGVRLVYERLDRVKSLPEELTTKSNTIVVGPFIGGKKSADVRKLALDGRKFVIGTFGDDPRATSWLRMQAAAAINEGYPRDRMLPAMTRDAAELVGASDKLGSLAVGRAADLVVFAGDPLDPSVPVRMTMSQGVVTWDNPKVEAVPTVVTAKLNLPEKLPPSYVVKTNRMLNAAGELVPGEMFIQKNTVTDLSKRDSTAPVIDVGNSVVTSGLVAGNVAFGSESAPDADASHLHGTDGLTNDDPRLRAYHDGGFSVAILSPSSGNVLAGTVYRVYSWRNGFGLGCGFKFVLTSAARNIERYPNSLVGQVELIRSRLKGATSNTQVYLPPSVSEAMLNVRQSSLDAIRMRELPAYFEAHTRTEIQAALALIAEFNLRGVIVEPRQVEDIVDEIRAAGVAVVIGPLRANENEKTIRGIVALARSGVPIVFGGGDANEMRRTATTLVNAGMERSAARLALTGKAGDRLGLETKGLRAPIETAERVLIWDGDPLDPGTVPTKLSSDLSSTWGGIRFTTPEPAIDKLPKRNQ